MSTIGLYDADSAAYVHVPFNLELMKLSSYHKMKRNIVALSPIFQPEKYGTFIYRKDFYDGNFPPEVGTNPKIIYGGRAFNRDKYIPLDEEAERQKPDRYIYSRIRKDFCSRVGMENAFRIMMNAEHFRLSLDGETVWKDFEQQIELTKTTHTLFLHDYNLNAIEGADSVIEELMGYCAKAPVPCALAVKFPIQINTSEDLDKWLRFTPSSYYFALRYNGLMEDAAFVDCVERVSKAGSGRIEYDITAGSTEEEVTGEKLVRLFHQAIYAREYLRPIRFVYPPNFFSDARWEGVIDLMNAYVSTTRNPEAWSRFRFTKFDTMYKFVYNLNEERHEISEFHFLKQDAREIFAFVREKNYQLFTEFYEGRHVVLKGDTLVYG